MDRNKRRGAPLADTFSRTVETGGWVDTVGRRSAAEEASLTMAAV